MVGLLLPRLVEAAPAATRPIAEALDVASLSCLDRDSLAVELKTWLRRDQVDNRISIVVRPGAGGSSRATVSFVILRDGKPIVERSLPHVEVACDQFRSAVGLAIAISVETMLVKAADEPRAPSGDASVLDFVPGSPKNVPRERRFSFGLRLVGAPVLLPRPAAAGSAELSARLASPFEVDASVMATSPVNVQIGSGSSDLSLVAGRLDGCAGSEEGLLGSRACLGVAAGRLTASGAGYSISYAPRLTWVAGVVRLEASIRVASGFRVAVGMDGVVPFVVPRLEVRSADGATVASTTLPGFGAMIFVGPQIDF